MQEKQELITGRPVDRLHPIQIGGRIRDAISEKGWTVGKAAMHLGTSCKYISEIITTAKPLTPAIAVRLHEIGLDGLELFLGQAAHQYWAACQNVNNADSRFSE